MSLKDVAQGSSESGCGTTSCGQVSRWRFMRPMSDSSKAIAKLICEQMEASSWEFLSSSHLRR